MYPIIDGHTATVRWLLEKGFDPNEADDFGGTALIAAAAAGATECVRMLLDYGADVHHCYHSTPSIGSAANLAIVRMLVNAGADLNDINGEMRAALTRIPGDGTVACTLEEYLAAKHRVFGNGNPQTMNFPFWQAMIRGGASAYHAREIFQQPAFPEEAGWCFSRFGKSINELPDGRIIEIAGEHEDHYDPDFCIYNDVIVHRGDGTFDIYGYPKSVFPPTDFHTATLVGSSIFIIGSLGYAGERKYGFTPLYRLDTDTLAIEKIETTGVSPGWISGHKAKLRENSIEIVGGKICSIAADKELYEDNPSTYVLNLTKWHWTRTVDGGSRLEE